MIVAHRHFVDGAVLDDEHAGSGSLTTDEHAQYVAMTVRATKRLYDANPHAKLVVAFQNWLRAAGASFDHLHKQLVAIDELGTDLEQQLARLGSEPDVYVRWGERYSVEQGLVIARNDHAVAVAGIGHRYPAVEVWCRVPGRPWELGAGVLRDFSDLLHAMHVATGAGRPDQRGVAPPAAVGDHRQPAAGGPQVARLHPGRLRGRHPDLRQHHRPLDGAPRGCGHGWPSCSPTGRLGAVRVEPEP